MNAYPTYSAQRIDAVDDLARTLLALYGESGYVRTEPSIIQPAATILDLEGEEMRHRTMVVTDPHGREACLRTDFTIPVCCDYIASGAATPARLCYHGPVFRYQPAEPERPQQFFQAGVEVLGHAERGAAELEVLSLAIRSLRAAGLTRVSVKLGDLSLFSDFVDALDLLPQWRERLKRHFWRSGYLDAVLTGAGGVRDSDARALLAHLGSLSEAEARPAFEGLMDLIGGGVSGARTREEIVDRLMEQAADAAARRLPSEIAGFLGALLAIGGPADAAIESIRALTKTAGVSLETPLAAMQARLAALDTLGIPREAVGFAARFGRNMEYYTGFVFELWSQDAEGPVQVAGGGRYDTLLEHLGAPRSIPAIGFAIRTERVLAARAAQGGAP